MRGALDFNLLDLVAALVRTSKRRFRYWGRDLRHIAAEGSSRCIYGAFKIDHVAAERLVKTLRSQVDLEAKNQKIELTLELKNGDRFVSDSLEDIEDFPFHNRTRESFQIELTSEAGARILVAFSEEMGSGRAWIHTGKLPNANRAIENLTADILHIKLWYSFLSIPRLVFSAITILIVNVILFLSIDSIIRYTSSIILLFTSLFLVLFVFMRLLFYPNLWFDFGLEGARLRSKSKLVWIILSGAGAIVLAAIGGGYFTLK